MSKKEFQPTEHPQLFVQDTEAHVECRVYNWKPLKDPTGRVIDVQRKYWSWTDAVAIVLLAWFLFPSDATKSLHRTAHIFFAVAALSLYTFWRCSTVIWESVIVIPPHGIQIETHRGFLGTPIFVSRKFIPTFLFRDIIINEALRRWNVVYYLAILSLSHDGEYKLDVLFENILPEFRILHRVQKVSKDRMLKGE